ncbi:sensor histidine kinase [Agromyces aerolatus]|uniref:sensor histidine kinase n=1 Tax=Agromyces sp. LY-1074 TaxID=3074080 RepID=UPI002866994F|nr:MULTISPECIES: histidine kinase [unclassified Agromyces]MDR5700239.1 histidine kinase [Agromyces sp. LY-1074]MDR5706393.1 histidine kinase [Agromyces sp. LY-1358]
MTTRLSRGRLVTDVVLAVLFALVCLPFALLGNGFDVAALALFTGALAVRRLAPGWSLGVAWFAALVQMLALRDLQLYDTAVLGVLYSTAAHGGRVLKWLGLGSAGVGALVATVYLMVVKPLTGSSMLGTTQQDALSLTVWFAFMLVASLSVLVLAWTAGLLVRAVRDSREIRRREEVATRERELVEYRYVVEQERNRIARDMHDVVAHSLAVVIAQADGARFAAATRPGTAVEALGTIAGVARGALGDVRLLLTELRHAEGGAPQPVLDDLDELLAQVRAAGLDVRFAEAGERVTLGTGHQIAVYRIVQEGLTNALRHGDRDAPVELSFSWNARGVRVEIVNVMRAGAVREASGHRHGIPGMRERAQLTGGTLHADVAGERFRLVAEIPATAAAPDAPATAPSGRNA